MRNVRVAFWFMVFLIGGRCSAQEEQELLDLRGYWKFEIGDEQGWAGPKFDDTRWAKVRVPAAWEDEGFPGYDGYAWYRTRFQVPESWRDKMLSLHLGTIDDVDEVYINGKFMAFSGSFPPDYSTAYDLPRSYSLPPAALDYGRENVLAVRVYDQQLAGGIIRGRVGIYETKDVLQPALSIAGRWKFKKGDDLRWKDSGINDADWREVDVPAYWETQGFKGYDGFGWYRTRFTIDPALAGSRPILLLGLIDDLDEAYVDGVRVGKTGSLPDYGNPEVRGNEYRELRAYTLPPEIAGKGGEHVLAVRVYDNFFHGGIYAGPIGVVERERFLEWQRRQGKKGNWLEWLFESIRW